MIRFIVWNVSEAVMMYNNSMCLAHSISKSRSGLSIH